MSEMNIPTYVIFFSIINFIVIIELILTATLFDSILWNKLLRAY